MFHLQHSTLLSLIYWNIQCHENNPHDLLYRKTRSALWSDMHFSIHVCKIDLYIYGYAQKLAKHKNDGCWWWYFYVRGWCQWVRLGNNTMSRQPVGLLPLALPALESRAGRGSRAISREPEKSPRRLSLRSNGSREQERVFWGQHLIPQQKTQRSRPRELGIGVERAEPSTSDLSQGSWKPITSPSSEKSFP